ncbi:MAG: hypothetical protein QM541_16790 [Flavobacterium sp.]|nr:hypothetical protein [Flavobacterium sp.]
MANEKYNIEESEFEPQLRRLISLTTILRKYGLLILVSLFGSLLALGGFAILRKRNIQLEQYTNFDYSDSSTLEMSMLLAVFFLVFFSVLILLRFNTLRNKGMIIYEELTDEIDWGRKRKEFIHRPPIETRIIIKEFLKATDLPFTTGTNGQAFYIVLLFIILISSIMIKVFV